MSSGKFCNVLLLLSIVVNTSTGFPHPLTSFPGRIVGGFPVSPHELPFQISIQRYGGHICGGAVYNRDYVITSAHCVAGLSTSYLKVVAGEHSLSSNDQEEQSLGISRITLHPLYNRLTLENDIALLKLVMPLSFNSAVGAIALPAPGSTASGNAVVSGWGTTSENGGSLADILRKVTVPIVTDTRCRSSYGSDIKDSMICAGFEEGGKDSCQGDSGGPLTVGSGSSKVLIGLVSWGYGCARPGYFGVYTEVSHFTVWIISTAASNAD